MKKLMISMLAMAAMVSCTNEIENPDQPQVNQNEPVEIQMNAGIYNVQTKTVGAIDGLPTEGNTITDIVFLRNDGTTADWSSADLKQIKATIASNGTVTFTEGKQYYPTKESETAYLIGFHPIGTIQSITAGSISFKSSELDGQKDIMYAPVTSGTKKSAEALKPAFAHKLSQLQFTFIKDASFISDATVAKIVVKGTHLPTSMNINDGAITYATSTSDITAFTDKTYAITADNKVHCGSIVMIEAVSAESAELTLTLDITLSDGTEIKNVNIETLKKPEIGKAHNIDLTFKQAEVSATASIAKWETGSVTGSGNVL